MAWIIVAGTLLIPTLWAVITYNRLVSLRHHVHESWSDIDVEQKRRYELIPDLVDKVKGYAAHERETLEQVVTLRNKAKANHGSASSQAVDETALLLGLKSLFVVVEGYPQLKADTHFLALQKQLANTEDRIAASRRFYNANVRDLNILRETFPTRIIASNFNFDPATFFELDNAAERVVPRIQLDEGR